MKVYLKKKKENREKWENIIIESLASRMAAKSAGCNGADIESIINESVEDWFLKGPDSKFEEILEEHTKNVINIRTSCAEHIRSMETLFKNGSFVDASS